MRCPKNPGHHMRKLVTDSGAVWYHCDAHGAHFSSSGPAIRSELKTAPARGIPGASNSAPSRPAESRRLTG